MNTSRQRHLTGDKVHPAKLPRGPHGRCLCRQCGTEVPRGRRTFCGEPCIAAWALDHNPVLQRAWVLRRDLGICAECQIDCLAVEEMSGADRLALGFPASGTCWNDDHIVEVVRGGGGKFDPSNRQTLCIPCHASKTSRLARERAWLAGVGRGLITLGNPSICVGKRVLNQWDHCHLKSLGWGLVSVVRDLARRAA